MDVCYAPIKKSHRCAFQLVKLIIIAEPSGEAGNRGARSRNAFVCMYI